MWAGLLWVPRILFFMPSASPRSCVKGYGRLDTKFLGDLACSLRAHACSSAVYILCSSASLLYVGL
jgi:hypothetical protein